MTSEYSPLSPPPLLPYSYQKGSVRNSEISSRLITLGIFFSPLFCLYCKVIYICTEIGIAIPFYKEEAREETEKRMPARSIYKWAPYVGPPTSLRVEISIQISHPKSIISHIMETQSFTEKESLELITRMLSQTKRNLTSNSGNVFLLYGYATVGISIVAYLLSHFGIFEESGVLYTLLFIPYLIQVFRTRKEKGQTHTYMDTVIILTWEVIGSLFALTFLCLLVFAMSGVTGYGTFVLMMPLSLLYAGIGTSITGVILRIKSLTFTPLIAFLTAMSMLVYIADVRPLYDYWDLLFGLSFLVMMVIPGHLMDRKK